MFQPRARLDLSVEAARERLISRLRPLSPTARPLASSLGSTLAEDLIADIALPRYTNSAMDGFAVRSATTSAATEDRPIRLAILGALEAGDAWAEPVGPNEAVRISTGAAVPADCDAVIPAERVQEHAGGVVITSPIDAGSNVRLQGEDITTGTIAIAAGTRIRPQEIGLMAALGIESILTVPRPSVSIVSIGPELFPDALPAPINDANGPMLAAQTERAGGSVVRVERCAGGREELAQLLDELGDASDLIITSGGISDSTADTMAHLLESRADSELWNVRLRPGKHVAVGFFGKHSLLSLPGNPVAAFVGFELFGRLAIDRLAGRSIYSTRQLARASQALTGSADRTDVLRGTAWFDSQGQLHVAQNERRGSGVVSSLPEANCLIVLPETVTAADPGDRVEIRWIG